MSEINRSERSILELIGKELPPHERELLVNDLSIAKVSHRSEDKHIVQFDLPDYKRPPVGQRPYSVEMSVKNSNGSEVYIIVFMDRNSRLLEIELIPVDESDIGELDFSSPKFHRMGD